MKRLLLVAALLAGCDEAPTTAEQVPVKKARLVGETPYGAVYSVIDDVTGHMVYVYETRWQIGAGVTVVPLEARHGNKAKD